MSGRWIAAGFLLLLPGAPASAQSLDRVETLARDGRIAEARTELTAWLDASWDDAGRQARQEALWYRRVLTLDPAQAATQFRRLALEYPGGEFTARAILRLARTALLEDDVPAAARLFEELRRDYPASAARLEAVEWLDANADRIAAARAAAAEAQEGSDAEPAVREDPGSPPVADTDADAADAPAGDWGVQLGAFSTVTRAQDLAERVRAAGFETRLVRVPGSDLVRLRVGVFEDAEAAEATYDRIVAAGFEAALVQDVSEEVPVG